MTKEGVGELNCGGKNPIYNSSFIVDKLLELINKMGKMFKVFGVGGGVGGIIIKRLCEMGGVIHPTISLIFW